MALFKVKIKIINISEGIVEGDDKAAATEKCNAGVYMDWWALRTTNYDSSEMVEIVEIAEEDPG